MPKGLVRIEGVPLVARQMDALRVLGAEVVVVTGVHHEVYLPHLSDAVVVRNPKPERGPFSSLQTGLAHMNGDVFMLPLDTMAPHASVWAALPSPEHAAAVPTFDGRGGHPVWLSQRICNEINTLDPGVARLDELLRTTPGVARISVNDPAVVTNLNTPDHVRELAAKQV
jgi:molybdenum cofactor cytidylyltransferase